MNNTNKINNINDINDNNDNIDVAPNNIFQKINIIHNTE